MLKKILISAVFTVFCLLSMTACTESLSYYEKLDTAIDLSDKIMELYSENAVSLGDSISSDNVADYCAEDEKMYSILNSDNESHDYKVYVIDDDKTLVATNVIFNAVEGYVVSFDDAKLPETIEVPENMGYDKNEITIISVDDVNVKNKYSNVYAFRGSLK